MFRGAHRKMSGEREALSPRAPRRRPPARRIRLELEELETRALLSASGVAPAAPAPPAGPPAGDVAQPMLVMVPQASGGVFGLTPAQVQGAYGFNQLAPVNGKAINGAGETIAIVDAYDDPNIVSDTSVFSTQFNLPQFNSSGGPTLKVVATGGGSPSTLGQNPGWAGEESLDVEWAHALAPEANILVVEAPSQSVNDLTAAVNYAASQPGVVTVSMSWGYSEFPSESSFDSTFTAPGVTYVAASGDNSAFAGPIWPASSPNVLAVGGTTLQVSTVGGKSNWRSESTWFGSGGGYSGFESQPTFQSNALGLTGARTTPDVSYDANPGTGFAIYDTFFSFGWGVVGGTSAGSPQWAAIVALADQQRSLQGGTPLDNSQVETTLYGTLANPTQYANSFHDITRGFNGYYAGKGYDLVTGLGSPKINNIVPLLAGTAVPAVSVATVGGSGKAGGGSSTPFTDHSHGVAPPTSGRAMTVASADGDTGSPAATVNPIVAAVLGLPVSTPATAAPSGGTAALSNNFLNVFNPVAPTSQGSLGGSTANLSGLVNAPVTQGGTVFGASGYSGSANAWRLDGYGMHGPAVDTLASDLASSRFAEPETQPDSAPSGEEEIAPDVAAPAVVLDGGGEGDE